MRRLYFGLLVAMLSLAAAPVGPGGRSITVPGASYIFGLSASPVGKTVAFYATRGPADGEGQQGEPALALFPEAGKLSLMRLGIPLGMDDFTIPVWTADGRLVYVSTGSGIYAVSPENDKHDLIIAGSTAGLALSADGAKLAFWHLLKSKSELVVYDLKSRQEVTHWNIANLFESDEYGHELAFSVDGGTVVGRTYDRPDQTPLKSFNVASGKVATIEVNCSGLVIIGKDIFYIAAEASRYKLFRVGSDFKAPELLAAGIRFAKLSAGGSPKWIVLQNTATRKAALFATQTSHLILLPERCDAATVFPDGAVACSREGKVFVQEGVGL